MIPEIRPSQRCSHSVTFLNVDFLDLAGVFGVFGSMVSAGKKGRSFTPSLIELKSKR
jgi:hypothetical protein